MRKRQDIIQQFSTFLSCFDEKSRSQHWVTQLELERSIKQHLEADPDKSSEQWALYFLEVLQSQAKIKGEDTREQSSLSSYPFYWQPDSTRSLELAKAHLSAYLQETCYQAAQKIQRQFRSVQHQYSIADLFQIGNVLINQPEKLFRSFKSDHQHCHIESYAKTAIFRFIGNTIYTQDIEAKREKFSDYGLLRDLSNKELKEALSSQGIHLDQIDLYCFARDCFNAVCSPQTRQNSRSIEAPNQADLAQMVHCYNQRHHLTLTGLLDVQAMQEMLSTCIQAARSYRTRRILTLEENGAISDPTPTPWEVSIQLEEREQIEFLVAQLFTSIPEVGQTLLTLWLGLDLTQTEIATVLKHKYPDLQKQYQVARQLGKYNRSLLKELLQQCHQFNPSLPLQDHKAIELIQAALEECLASHCRRLVYAALNHTQQFCNQPQSFTKAFEKQLEADLDLSSESLKVVDRKIGTVVDEWVRSR